LRHITKEASRFIPILFMAILLNGLLAPVSDISLAQTDIDTSTTNSIDSNFLTYEDTARGFIMQYPFDWNKTDYPPTIPIVGFMSPAQNTTDRTFENMIVVVELLPTQNITLDQYSHSVIEQLGLDSPELDVISPPKETMLGGAPAYNMTTRMDEYDPSVVHEL
jgi:hypothetical protein